MDGSAAQTGARAGVVVTSPEGYTFEYAVCFGFKVSNNKVECEATIAGISLCIAVGFNKI